MPGHSVGNRPPSPPGWRAAVDTKFVNVRDVIFVFLSARETSHPPSTSLASLGSNYQLSSCGEREMKFGSSRTTHAAGSQGHWAGPLGRADTPFHKDVSSIFLRNSAPSPLNARPRTGSSSTSVSLTYFLTVNSTHTRARAHTLTHHKDLSYSSYHLVLLSVVTIDNV